MRHSISWGFFSLLACVSYGGSARAQQLGERGTLSIGAERLFGVSFLSANTEQAGADVTAKQTVVSLLAGYAGETPDNVIYASYATPRLGVDYFVINGLSVGGSLGFFTVSDSVSTEVNGTTVDQDGDSGNGILVNLRAGYAYMFAPKVGIWPRAGITYVGGHRENDDATREDSVNSFGLTLELPFVIAPVPHVAFLIYPFWDIGLTGGVETKTPVNTTSIDATYQGIGLQTGLAVTF